MRMFLLFLFFASSICAMEKEVSFAESPKEKRRRVTARLITSFVGKESDTLTKHVGKVFMKKVKQSDAGDPEFWEAVNQVIEEKKSDKKEENIGLSRPTSFTGAAVTTQKDNKFVKKLEKIKELLISSLEEAVAQQHNMEIENKYIALKHKNHKINMRLKIMAALLGATSFLTGGACIFGILIG